jgi:predicted 3-demethylubiquinone-9 3-methyltransferase (glyoxalase superfamily)
MQKITPFLWFNGQAEEAVNFYVSIFKNSRITSVTRYGDAGPGPKGTVMSAIFQLEGQEFFALNGGPQFTFTPAISFFISCETQQEVDDFWQQLSAEARQTNAAGCAINSACPGKSSRKVWARCFTTRIRQNPLV